MRINNKQLALLNAATGRRLLLIDAIENRVTLCFSDDGPDLIIGDEAYEVPPGEGVTKVCHPDEYLSDVGIYDIRRPEVRGGIWGQLVTVITNHQQVTVSMKNVDRTGKPLRIWTEEPQQ